MKKYYYSGGARIAMKVESTPVQPEDGLYFFLTDHLGSTTVTIKDGALGGQMKYLAWGESRPGGSLPTSFGYTGQRAEDALGILFYKSRWYDGKLGRFLQPDTLVPESQGVQAWNRYTYVNNSPVNFNDPSGHCLVVCTALIGAVVGFSVDILIQSVPQIVDGKPININWAEAGGAAVAGAIAGGTMGVGLVVAGSVGATAGGTIAIGAGAGALGNVVGNQAGSLVQSSIETKSGLLSNENKESASQYGWAQSDQIAWDLGIGALTGAFTTGLSLKAPTNVPKGLNQNFEPYIITNKLGNPISKPNFQVDPIRFGFTSTVSKGLKDPHEWLSGIITNNSSQPEKKTLI